MQKFIVRHDLRTNVTSLVIVLVSGGLILHASMQDAVIGIERSQQPDTANHNDGLPEFSDATIVVRWSQLAQDNAFAVDPAMTDPFPNARGWTMMYLAMHDALNAIVPRFRQYAFFGTATSAHPLAAAAQAARDVMNHIYPTRQAENDAELAFWLGQISDGRAKTRGINLGIASATAIINGRANDRFVPPLEFVYRPAFGDSTPFAISSGAAFLPTPPPPLTSGRFRSTRRPTPSSARPLLRRSVRSSAPTASASPRSRAPRCLQTQSARSSG